MSNNVATKGLNKAKTKVTMNTDFSLSNPVGSTQEFDEVSKSGKDFRIYIW